MVSAIPRARSTITPLPFPVACCLDHTHDASRLAGTIASVASPGTLLDIGCGLGAVSIPVLVARPDLRAVGIEVSASAAAMARYRAASRRVANRFSVITGDVFTVPLPHARSVVANPPMLPSEPWFTMPAGPTREALFWTALLRRLGDRPDVADVLFHLFDFQGVGRRFGELPAIEEVARQEGFEVSYPHRGWRACGPSSAIWKALPALGRLFPEAIASVSGGELRFADLPRDVVPPLFIRHSIVRLNRARPLAGDLR
jgi:SAM-dependent methyltransferase